MTTRRFLPEMNELIGEPKGDAQSRRPTVLLVDDRNTDGSLLVRQLNSLGFCCAFAHSLTEAKARLSVDVFDIVLSKLKMIGGTAYELRPLLIGRPTSLFYSLAVEQDCWWIPGVRRGTECLGEPALRPDEFFKALVLAADSATAGAAGGAQTPAN